MKHFMKYGDILNYAIIIIAIVVVRQTNSSDDGGFIRIFRAFAAQIAASSFASTGR